MATDLEFVLQTSFEGIHPKYRELIERTFEMVGDGVFKAPASSKHHHAYPGGLKDHLVEVRNLCKVMGEQYPQKVNMNVLETSAILHDVAKHMNYVPNILKKGNQSESKPYKRTAEARVLEHIGEAIVIITQAGTEVGFTRSRLKPILHCIASHHGDTRFGWGSIINPDSAEAQILFNCDMISSRLANMPTIDQALEKVPQEVPK